MKPESAYAKIAQRILQFKFPETRKYPIAFATFILYLAWHPLGDFIESLFIGWSIVPCNLFSHTFWKWWVPFAQHLNESYALAFFAYFIPITMFAYAVYFIFKKYKKIKLNKHVKLILLAAAVFFILFPPLITQLNPETSVAYLNDMQGFRAHNMQPLDLWMYFHMSWWFLWMIFPHILGLYTAEKTMLKISGIVWLLFLLVWLGSWLFRAFFYIPIAGCP